MKQFIIAFDQLINTIVYIKGDGCGWADETLSARAYRLRDMSSLPYRVINAVFFWQEDHCRESYESELLNKHLPKEYSA